MDRREVVERLASLRREVEAEAGVSVAELETSFALALFDVCGALELTKAERTEVLGIGADSHMRYFLDERVWVAEGPVEAAA